MTNKLWKSKWLTTNESLGIFLGKLSLIRMSFKVCETNRNNKASSLNNLKAQKLHFSEL